MIFVSQKYFIKTTVCNKTLAVTRSKRTYLVNPVTIFSANFNFQLSYDTQSLFFNIVEC